MHTHYQILGLSEQATLDEIKRAFKKLAVQYHPDKNPNNAEAEEMFKLVNEAYQTLSDTEKRHRYDSLLYYYRNSTSQTETELPKVRPAERRPKPRRPYYYPYGKKPKTYNPYFERIGNRWAIGFIFFCMIATIAFVNITEYFNNKKAEEVRVLKASVFEQSRQFINEGKFDSSFVAIRDLEAQLPYDREVNSYKIRYVQYLMQNAEGYFSLDQCDLALTYFKAVVDNYEEVPSVFIYKMALCQKQSGKGEDAFATMQLMLIKEPESIIVHNEIAKLYHEYFDDYQQALVYYQKAVEFIVKDYESYYGSAYALVLIPEKTPEVHYDTHFGISLCFLKFKQFQQAENAILWAKFLRPNYTKTYEIEGLIYFEKNEKVKACESWATASNLGSDLALNLQKLHCK